MPMAYAACEQSHPSSSLPTFSKTTAPLSLDEIETLFNNAPDSGSVFMEAISMSNDPFIGAPKISITLDSTEAFVFQEFDSAIHHDEEKFTYTGPNKEMLLNSILVAGKQWLTVFLDEVLPSLDVSLHKTFQELVSQEGWSEAQVAATILLLIAKQVGNDRITRAFDKLLEPVSKPQELADYIEVALLLKDDATELKTFLIQTKRELA